MAPLIEMRGIERTYVMGDNLVQALRGVDLVIEKGASIAIMGTSGSGKSTMMNIMGCLDQPTKGSYALNGKDVSRLSRAELADVRGRMIGFVFQSFNLLSRTSALENVEMPLMYQGVPARQRHKRAMEALERVKLADRADHHSSQLSGGQQQRVAIARALVGNAPIIMADEPTGNLDSKTSYEVMATLQELVSQGITVVLVTHEHDIAAYARRVVVLRDGLIVEDKLQDPNPYPGGIMSIFTTLKLAFRALWRNQVRSLLTMLGIIFGIGTVIAMIASGEGAREAVADVFRAMGTNLLIITNGSQQTSGAAGGAGSRMSLTWNDLTALENGEVPTLRWVVPVLQTKVQVAGEDTNWNTGVVGTKPNYFKIKNWAAKSGELFDDDAATTGAKVAVIGQTVATQLYGNGNPIGQPIRINGQPFEVIAVLESKGQSAMGQDQDDVVVLPLKSYMNKLDKGVGKYITKGQIYASVGSEDEIDHAQAQITAFLRQAHNLSATDDDDFRIRNLAEFAMSQQQSTDRITKLLAIVAAMSLIVGGIGVMNIMLVSVIERTREIGIRMAVGAKPVDVMTQFLVESLVLAAVGGVLGLGFGALLAKYMASYYGWKLFFPAATAAIAFAVAGGVGVVFGLYPAIRASRLDPITALRYET